MASPTSAPATPNRSSIASIACSGEITEHYPFENAAASISLSEMKRSALSRRIAMLAALAICVALPVAAAASYSPFHPLSSKGNSAALREKIAEEFPGARFPAREGNLCSSEEHSPYGPTSYCFAEFTTGRRWNLVEAAVTLDLVGGTGLSVRIYRHTSWRRKWRRCRLGKLVPGRLFANDDCGRGQPERHHVVTDQEMIEFEVLPKIRSRRPIRSVSREFIYADAVPSIAVYRASRNGRVYKLTNAVGDSLRYRYRP